MDPTTCKDNVFLSLYALGTKSCASITLKVARGCGLVVGRVGSAREIPGLIPVWF